MTADHAARGTALLAAGQPAAARTALRTAVALGDAAPAVLLNMALAEAGCGDTARARALMHEVAATCEAWEEPWVRLAESHRAAGEGRLAEAAYRAALERAARRGDALAGLAGVLLARGEAAEARALLLRCLGLEPDRAEAWDALGIALLALGDPATAGSAFIEAQRLAPGELDYALRGLDAAFAAGAAEAEEARLDLAIEADPANAVPQAARGMLLERTGRRDAAIDALTASTLLCPTAPDPALLLGGVLARSARLAEADAALAAAAALAPEEPRILNDRAAVLMRMHRHAEARELLEAHIARFGEPGAVLCNLANATACLGMQEEAVAIARRAAVRDPAALLPLRALCNTLPYRDGIGGMEMRAALCELGDRLPRAGLGPCRNDRDPDRPLVVGLLSGSLKTHPVGWLTIAGFETLDPDAFRLVALAQNGATTDPIARRFRAVAQDWVAVDGLDDVALARRAREMGIDILIDLGGYGDAARMTACAHRLAPVQVKWVGMQNHGTGLAEMDWFLTDRWETPEGFERFYTERLLRMDDGYACYSPPPYAPDVAPLPALENGFATFGCLNNLAKITPAGLDAWAAILRALPDARLVLKTHQFADAAARGRIHEAFAARGVDPHRVDPRGPSGHRAFMTEYNHIDIALDPFPYSGGLTTCEALWMGVPTVMLPGEIFAARHSFSHMSNAGLTGWDAQDAAGYIRLAVARARALPELAALRAGLREQVRRSPLCDAPRFGRALGRALRGAWRAWCEEGEENATKGLARSNANP